MIAYLINNVERKIYLLFWVYRFTPISFYLITSDNNIRLSLYLLTCLQTKLHDQEVPIVTTH